MIKKLFFAMLIMVQGAALYAQNTVINDPNAEARSVGGFSAISISGGIDLYLSQGNEDGVAVSASDIKFRDQMRTSVENGVLKIWFQGNNWRSYRGNKKMIAYVSFKSIKSLHAAGASDVYVNGTIKAEAFKLDLSGASDFKGAVETGKFVVEQSGASDATITGKVAILDVEVSGASNFKGYDLQTENCSAKASGASDVRVTVNKELSAEASGASSVSYRGEATPKSIHSSGASHITKKS